MSSEIEAHIRLVWDAYYRSHYWVLSGTKTVLDGTVLAVRNDPRSFEEQARSHLAELNERRAEIGLLAISVAEL